jgi:hypothetical protein
MYFGVPCDFMDGQHVTNELQCISAYMAGQHVTNELQSISTYIVISRVVNPFPIHYNVFII